MDLNHLRTFHLVVRHGTLAGAARALGVPTSTISRSLTNLESTLEVDLLHRGSRGITLTDAGSELFERSKQPLDDLHELTTALPVNTPKGTLRISVPSNLANLPWFASLLLAFRRNHPEVMIDVGLSVGSLDLTEGGFDVGFRPAVLVPDSPDLIRRALPAIDVRLYASAHYVSARGRPERVEDLEAHDFVAARHLANKPLTLSRGDETICVAPKPVMVGDDLSFVLPIVAAGGGYAAIPTPYVADRDAFVELLPQWTLPALRPTLVWPRRRFMALRVRAFVDFIAAGFDAYLQPTCG